MERDRARVLQVPNLFRFAQSGPVAAIPSLGERARVCVIVCVCLCILMYMCICVNVYGIKIVQFTLRCARKAAEKQPDQIYYAATTLGGPP